MKKLTELLKWGSVLGLTVYDGNTYILASSHDFASPLELGPRAHFYREDWLDDDR